MASKKQQQLKSIADLKPDLRNANKGTERGRGMLERSLSETGIGRSILVDKSGRVIAGNKTLEVWATLADDTNIEVVHTDGRKLVVVQRDDLDLDDPKGLARKLAYYDNRTNEIDLDWNPEEVFRDMQAGADLSELWGKEEIETLLESFQIDGTQMPSLDGGDKSPFQAMSFTLTESQVRIVQEALLQAKTMASDVGENKNSNGNALTYICEVFNGIGKTD